MKRRILDILACPKCRGDLVLGAAKIACGEVKEGVLKCTKCQSTFPIVRFIPRFVRSDMYVDSFSFEWKMHRRLQFGRDSEESFVLKTQFTQDELKGKLVLDVGCGSGRYMDVALKRGAEVMGFDLSYSVDEALQNLGLQERLHLVQADVYTPPFKEAVFDYVYSIGVLHHTPNTKRAFLSLPVLLKRGGRISIWVYARSLVRTPSGFYRRFTTRMPKRLLHWMCHAAVPIYYFQRVPYLGALLHITIPTSPHTDWRWRVLDTYDWYSPRYQHKHTFEEVVNWFEEAGLVKIKVLGFPVSVTGEKMP